MLPTYDVTFFEEYAVGGKQSLSSSPRSWTNLLRSHMMKMTAPLDWQKAIVGALLASCMTRSHGLLGQVLLTQRHFSTEKYQTPFSFDVIKNPLHSLLDILPSLPSDSAERFCKAQEIVTTLVKNDNCFSSETGAAAFGKACATDVVYEDCYLGRPLVGREVCHCLFARYFNIL
jgi:hypothetical protein